MAKTKNTKKSARDIRLVNLKPDTVLRLPKPHAGFESFAQPLVEFYKSNEAALHIEGFDADALLTELEAYQALAAPLRKAAQQLHMLQETRLLHGSTVWSGMLEIHARAVVVGRVNADVARGIVEFAQFMKTGPRKKKGNTPAAA